MSNKPVTITLTDAPPKSAFGVDVNVLLTGEITGGQYTTYRCSVPPNVGPPPHRHEGFDEGFYVLEGIFEVLSDESVMTIGPGDSIFVPRGSVHTFRCVGPEVGVFLGTATPAGHEQFFYDTDELAKAGITSQEAAFEVCARNGIEIVIPVAV